MMPAMPTYLDLDHWPRRDTYRYFRGFDKPYFNVCTRLDLTELVALKPMLGGSLLLAYHHLVLRLANEMQPLRLRIEGERVRVLDVVHGGMTVLRPDDSIAFAYVDYHEHYPRFIAEGLPRMRAMQQGDVFDPGVDDDGMLHFTTLPWVDFSSFSHARNWGREDSVPKLAFGRLQREGERWKMAMSIEVHHALMDGLHVGRFVQALEARLVEPARWLGLAP